VTLLAEQPLWVRSSLLSAVAPWPQYDKVVNQHRRLWGVLTVVLRERGVNDRALASFLPSTYLLKRIADYESGSSEITGEAMEKVVAEAEAYTKHLREIAERPR
jgi:hypothetical protein